MFLKFGEVPVVVASSREAAREVMKTHDAILSSRPQTSTVKIINRGGTDLVLAPYGDHWRQLRKICMVELLCAKRVQSFRAIREEEAMRLIQAVSPSSSSSSASASNPHAQAQLVNLTELLASYANDTAVRCVMGDRLSNRDTFLRYVTRAIGLAGTFRLADLFPSSKLACALSRTISKAEVLLDDIYKFMDGVISEQLERRRSIQREEEFAHHQEDMTGALLRIQKQGDLQHPITMGTVKAVLFVCSCLDCTIYI